MKKDKNIKSYTADELRALRSGSRTDLARVDAVSEEALAQAIAEDAEERDVRPDWTQARIVLPRPKQSVHLRLDAEVIEFFRTEGKGHIARMQAVLKAYVEAHRR